MTQTGITNAKSYIQAVSKGHRGGELSIPIKGVKVVWAGFNHKQIPGAVGKMAGWFSGLRALFGDKGALTDTAKSTINQKHYIDRYQAIYEENA